MESLNKFFEDVYINSILLAFIKLCEMKASDIATPYYVAIKSKSRHKIIKLGSIGYPHQNTEKK